MIQRRKWPDIAATRCRTGCARGRNSALAPGTARFDERIQERRCWPSVTSGRPNFAAHQFRQFAAGEEQAFDHALIQVAAGRGHGLAAVGRMQHLRRREDGHGRTVDPRQGLSAAVGQILFWPEHAIGAFAIPDTGEAALEGADIGGGVFIVVDGINNMERWVLARGHGVGFRGCI